MNNIERIINFIKNRNETKLLVNEVSEEIGFFYVNLVENEAHSQNIRLNYNSFGKENTNSLFDNDEISLIFLSSKKIIEEQMISNQKCIIFTDYRNFKKYASSTLSVNGYDYYKDINFYIKKVLQIDNSDLIDFCVNTPYLTFSEISKYMVNNSGYAKENEIKKDNNFILDIRKELFNLKKNQNSAFEIYSNLKKEVKYKKFNFLAY